MEAESNVSVQGAEHPLIRSIAESLTNSIVPPERETDIRPVPQVHIG